MASSGPKPSRRHPRDIHRPAGSGLAPVPSSCLAARVYGRCRSVWRVPCAGDARTCLAGLPRPRRLAEVCCWLGAVASVYLEGWLVLKPPTATTASGATEGGPGGASTCLVTFPDRRQRDSEQHDKPSDVLISLAPPVPSQLPIKSSLEIAQGGWIPDRNECQLEAEVFYPHLPKWSITEVGKAIIGRLSSFTEHLRRRSVTSCTAPHFVRL